MNKVITPICRSRPPSGKHRISDAEALTPHLSALSRQSAKILGVCAIAQKYRFTDGSNRKDGSALLLTRPSFEGDVSALEKDTLRTGSLEVRHYEILCGYMADLRIPTDVAEDMIDVSHAGQWLFTFPGLLLMQTTDICSDVESTVHILKGDPASFLWSRSACGRLRFPYPTSNHQRLHLLQNISNAMDIVKSFRSSEIRTLENAGYEIGPVTLESLNRDLGV